MIVKYIFKTVLLLIIPIFSSYGFVGAISLLEKNDKLVLVVADRHSSSGDIPKHLHDKEQSDFQVLAKFTSNLIRNNMQVDFVLESSRPVGELSQAESLLQVIPWYASKGEKRYPQLVRAVHSDHRRGDVIQLIPHLHQHGYGALGGICFKRLQDLNQWSPDEVEWFNRRKGTEILFADLIPIIDRHFKDDDDFARFVVEKSTQVLAEVEKDQREWIGETLKLNHFRNMFLELEKELDGEMFSVARRDIEVCKTELSSYVREMEFEANSSLATLILNNIKKSRSIASIDFGRTKISDCAMYSVADSGFFYDVMKSQENRPFTVLFAGRAHGAAVSTFLKKSGYRSLFEEGQMVATKGLQMRIDINGDDPVLETEVLNQRLDDTFEHLASKKIKDEL